MIHVSRGKFWSEIVFVVNVIKAGRRRQTDDVREGASLLHMKQEVYRVLLISRGFVILLEREESAYTHSRVVVLQHTILLEMLEGQQRDGHVLVIHRRHVR